MFSEKRGNVLHGVLLIALFSCSAFYIAEFQFIKQLSFSPLIVGIILGMLYANSLRNLCRRRGFRVSCFVLSKCFVRVSYYMGLS